MPELPEVEAITARAARHCIGQMITRVEVIRQPRNNAYFGDVSPVGGVIERVYRRGKHVLFELKSPFAKGPYADGAWIDCHNAMTGYWDYEDDPWTFDYVEGPRKAADHVRVRLHLGNGRVLRFHDARFFGRLSVVGNAGLPRLGPELMQTPFGAIGPPVISLSQFARGLLTSRDPVKHLLMDQQFLAGIGNIYANEACHLAAVDPIWPACAVPLEQIPILLEALRFVVGVSIPQVKYDHLRVYRRSVCGTCAGRVLREQVKGRATFSCPRCQHE